MGAEITRPGVGDHLALIVTGLQAIVPRDALSGSVVSTYSSNVMVRRWVAVVLVPLSLAAGFSGCNRGHHATKSSTTTTATATTLPVPAGPALAVRPATGPVGTSFTLTVTQFHPGETLRFEIRMPDGKIFRGQFHQVPASGTVTAPYNTGTSNPPGGYTVTAATEKGARAQATFTLTPASSSTSRLSSSSTITTGKAASTTATR